MGSRELLLTALLFLFSLLSAELAFAQIKSKKLKKLTIDNVSAFIEDTSILTSNQNIDRDNVKIEAYLEKHIDTKARFRSSITYVMPNLPAQEKILTLKKEDYIDQVKKGADSVDHYHSEIEIGDIKISKNKKTASVNTVMTESGIMQVPDENGGMQDVPIDGRSECFQVLKLVKKAYIQMYSANCTTIMQFLPN